MPNNGDSVTIKDLLDFFQGRQGWSKDELLSEYVEEVFKAAGQESTSADELLISDAAEGQTGMVLSDFVDALFEKIIEGVCNVIKTAPSSIASLTAERDEMSGQVGSLLGDMNTIGVILGNYVTGMDDCELKSNLAGLRELARVAQLNCHKPYWPKEVESLHRSLEEEQRRRRNAEEVAEARLSLIKDRDSAVAAVKEQDAALAQMRGAFGELHGLLGAACDKCGNKDEDGNCAEPYSCVIREPILLICKTLTATSSGASTLAYIKGLEAVVTLATTWFKACVEYNAAMSKYKPETSNKYPDDEYQAFVKAGDALYDAIDAHLKGAGKDA